MATIIEKSFVEIYIGADKPVLPQGKSAERILEFTLKAPPAPDERPHVPLNLALVLDRSGSMHGEKLRYVKQAALQVVDLMTELDRAAVVIYDDKVQTLMASQFMTGAVKNELRGRIQAVQTGGSTNLEGGWLSGCRQVAEVLNDQTINRTLLLTDGLANVGERDPRRLSMHAKELYQRKISTSCFGAGADYDEFLLEAMANQGGGNFHFLETVQAIPLVFEREFDELVNILVRDLRVELHVAESIQVTVPAGWQTERAGNQVTILLGSLPAEGEKKLYVRLANLAIPGGEQFTIPIRVSGVDADGVEHTLERQAVFKLVPAAEEAAQPQDADLMARFAEVDLADKAKQALQRERAGDRLGASAIMNDNLTIHSPNISEKTRGKYQRLSRQMSMGMDKLERKRSHFDMYQSSRTKAPIQDYRPAFNGGVLSAEIDGKRVLVDTTAPTSFGREPEWTFLGEWYQLPPSSAGRTCDQLSAELGFGVDLVLGMDILQALYLQVDPVRKVITFSRQPLRARGWRLDLQPDAKGVTCRIPLGGKDLPLRIATAVKRSLALPEWLKDLPPVGHERVELPGLTPFETDLFRREAQLGRKTLSLTFGGLPSDVRAAYDLAQGEGLIGADVFQMLPTTLAFPQGRWVLMI